MFTWTKEKPTEAGWYWIKADFWSKEKDIVYIESSAEGLCLYGTDWPVDVYDAEWAGPIPEPRRS